MFKEKRVKIISLFYLFAILILTKPDYLGSINAINNIYNTLLPITIVAILIFSFKNNSFNKAALLLSLFYLFIMLMTYINDGNITSLISPFFIILSYFLLIGIGLKRDKCRFIKILSIVYFTYNLINFISIIAFPNGLFLLDAAEKSWFLGHKNGLIKWLLPGFSFVGTFDLIKYDKFKIISYFYLIIMISSILISSSTTSIISIVVLVVLLFLKFNRNLKLGFINTNSVIISNFAFFIGVIVLRLQKYFESIFTFLNKTTSFTGRDILWDRILVYIKNNVLFGNGNSNSELMQYRLKYSNTSSHNLLLDYLYEGGIFCIAILICILLEFEKKLISFKNKNVVSFINIVFFSYSIVWMTETFLGKNMINVFSIISFGCSLLYLNDYSKVNDR